MWRARPALALALGALLTGVSTRAEAPAPTVSLEVIRDAGAESCLESAALETAVERRLERPVFVPAGRGAVGVNLHFVRRTDRSFAAEVVLLDRHGTALGRRELKTRAAHCSALDDSLALVVALLVDSPEAREQAAAAPTTAHPAAPPSSAAPPVAASASAPRQTSVAIPPDVAAPREPYRFVVGASAAALAGPLPGLAWGAELFFAVRPPRFVELRLRPSLFPEREVTGPTPDQGGRLALISVALDICPLEHGSGRLRLSGCVGQSVGWARGEGFGYRQNANTGTLVYSLGVGASALIALAGPLGLEVGLGGAVPLERDTYVSHAENGATTEVFRAAPVTGMLAAGLALEL
jgi:hypothetical protein